MKIHHTDRYLLIKTYCLLPCENLLFSSLDFFIKAFSELHQTDELWDLYHGQMVFSWGLFLSSAALFFNFLWWMSIRDSDLFWFLGEQDGRNKNLSLDMSLAEYNNHEIKEWLVMVNIKKGCLQTPIVFLIF